MNDPSFSSRSALNEARRRTARRLRESALWLRAEAVPRIEHLRLAREFHECAARLCTEAARPADRMAVGTPPGTE
jgi:hypothetical protein